MKKIKLTQGKFALVDDEDFEFLNQWKWYAHKKGHTFYAVRNSEYFKGKQRTMIFMHRVILNSNSKLEIDHKDRNGLNNQKNNLRLCHHYQNCRNRKQRIGGTSRFTGVSWCNSRKKWIATITIDGKSKYIGVFKNENDAALAYNKIANNIFGEFANLNKV